MEGVVKNSKYVYEKVTKVYPTKHEYENGVKWSCPVCDQLNNHHQLLENETNCPLCNVNLCWDRK